MEPTAGAPPGRALTLPVLLVALGVIAILAAAPFVAVRAMADRRLRAADRDEDAIASLLARVPPDRLAGASLYLGPGTRPPAVDPAWNAAAALPLDTLVQGTGLHADPWGNAYLVTAGRFGNRLTPRVWSAGPDGILESSPGGAAVRDDRVRQ